MSDNGNMTNWRYRAIFIAIKVVVLAGMYFFISCAHAQTATPSFAPPIPPPPDAEFDELEEEPMDPETASRPPPPPPPGAIPNPSDFRPPSAQYGGMGNNAMTPGKVRFRLVEGEFFEKGKPRGRGKK